MSALNADHRQNNMGLQLPGAGTLLSFTPHIEPGLNRWRVLLLNADHGKRYVGKNIALRFKLDSPHRFSSVLLQATRLAQQAGEAPLEDVHVFAGLGLVRFTIAAEPRTGGRSQAPGAVVACQPTLLQGLPDQERLPVPLYLSFQQQRHHQRVARSNGCNAGHNSQQPQVCPAQMSSAFSNQGRRKGCA